MVDRWRSLSIARVFVSTYADNIQIGLDSGFHESLNIRHGSLEVKARKPVGRIGLPIAFGREHFRWHVEFHFWLFVQVRRLVELMCFYGKNKYAFCC